ncbi:MAG: hypothetical protein AAF266_02790 [Planctomycetota bacterium]
MIRSPLCSRVLVLGIVLVAGCNQRPFSTVGVTGSVLYEDGEPIPAEGYKLRFVPQVESPDGKTFPRVATALVDGAGNFDGATSYKYFDGITAGDNIVYFDLGSRERGKKLMPEEYLSPKTSPLTIDTAESRTIDIRLPRP